MQKLAGREYIWHVKKLMRSSQLISCALLLAFSAMCIQSKPQNATPTPGEHTWFTESERFEHPVLMPPNVFEVLRRRKEVAGTLDYVGGRQPKPSGFEATTLHIGNSDDDLLVRGIPPVSGADNVWYWLVLRTQSESPKVVLWCAADSLEVMTTLTNGYKDIVCSWSSPSDTTEWKYHFNGNRYVLWKKVESENH
jgi:hypothetical protein